MGAKEHVDSVKLSFITVSVNACKKTYRVVDISFVSISIHDVVAFCGMRVCSGRDPVVGVKIPGVCLDLGFGSDGFVSI